MRRQSWRASGLRQMTGTPWRRQRTGSISELAEAPNEMGESRSGNRRIAHWLPLGISFEVREADRQVSVVAVWECRKTG